MLHVVHVQPNARYVLRAGPGHAVYVQRPAHLLFYEKETYGSVLQNMNAIIHNEPTLSVVAVHLNSGNKLAETLNSILAQDYQDYEVVVKDGGSSDSSLEMLPNDPRIRIVAQADSGIYEAMNQAVSHCRSRYVQFLNAGDLYFSNSSLKDVFKETREADILYSNIFHVNCAAIMQYPRKLTRFFLFRKNLCHQSMIVKRTILAAHPFDTTLRILSDRDFLLTCILTHHYSSQFVPVTLVAYEGGGLSETQEANHLFHSELSLVRKRHFKCIERLLLTVVHEVSLYRLRRWLITTSNLRTVARLHIKLANMINSRRD
jgi:glycosyltransferase involved in cell wall biosynthesis